MGGLFSDWPTGCGLSNSAAHGAATTRQMTRGLVVGHYQPLADNPCAAPQNKPKQAKARPNRFSAVDSENTRTFDDSTIRDFTHAGILYSVQSGEKLSNNTPGWGVVNEYL